MSVAMSPVPAARVRRVGRPTPVTAGVGLGAEQLRAGAAADGADQVLRRARWTTAAAVVLAIFGAALVIASQRAAAYVGPVAFAAGVGEIVLAGLLLLRVRHAGTIGVVAATTGLAFTGIAALAALGGRDPFVALGGAGGDAKNLLAAVAFIAIGYLVVLVGARRAA